MTFTVNPFFTRIATWGANDYNTDSQTFRQILSDRIDAHLNHWEIHDDNLTGYDVPMYMIPNQIADSLSGQFVMETRNAAFGHGASFYGHSFLGQGEYGSGLYYSGDTSVDFVENHTHWIDADNDGDLDRFWQGKRNIAMDPHGVELQMFMNANTGNVVYSSSLKEMKAIIDHLPHYVALGASTRVTPGTWTRWYNTALDIHTVQPAGFDYQASLHMTSYQREAWVEEYTF